MKLHFWSLLEVCYTIHFQSQFLPNLLVRWWHRQDVEAALQSFYEAPTKVVEVGTVKTITPISSRFHRDFIDFIGKKWDFTGHIQQISALFSSFGVGFHHLTTGLPGTVSNSDRSATISCWWMRNAWIILDRVGICVAQRGWIIMDISPKQTHS